MISGNTGWIMVWRTDPPEWKTLIEGQTEQYDPPERIYTWDVSDITAGTVTLRIYVTSTEDTYAEKRIRLNLQVPTSTPTITPTPTVTPNSYRHAKPDTD